jgi:DNA-binding NarL/FixJ family response regulator
MKRVFVLTSHSLLGSGVGVLLRSAADLEVVGCESDLERAIAQIIELRPDVVVAETADLDEDWAHIMARTCQAGLQLCVVGVHLHDNRISIYQGEQRTVHDVEDLLRAVRH